MRSKPRLTLLCVVVILAGCHRREGTRPEDMSITEHERAAETAEAKAVVQAAAYDPDPLWFAGSDCSEFCFRANPTLHHLRAAKRLRRRAAAHREASHELRVAEARACAGIPEYHRDFSPFYHLDDITGAELDVDGTLIVHFDKIPKTTVWDLRQLVDCHLTRNAATGYRMQEMEYCPLAVPGISATVTESEQGFDIRLEGDTTEARAEAGARVEALLVQQSRLSAR